MLRDYTFSSGLLTLMLCISLFTALTTATHAAPPGVALVIGDSRLCRPAPIIATPSVDPGEAAYWAEVKKSEDPADYATYLAAYPNGHYLADANEYIERNKQPKAAREQRKS